MRPIDIVHLTFKPPFAPGSFNRMVGTQMEKITGLNQAVISYCDQPISANDKTDDRTILVNGERLSILKKAILQLPERLRRNRFNGVTARDSLTYLWQILEILPRLKPKVIVCYDNYKFGRLLRQHINWPCRLVLSQHGLSYLLSADVATKLYNLQSFDTVWTLTLSSYRFDRQRISAYEPTVNVIHNWIDVDQFRPVTNEEKKALRQSWGLHETAPVVLCLGRLTPKKGAHVLVQSWRKVVDECPDAVLWIVGGGDQSYINYLQDLTKNLGLTNNVKLQGAVPPEQTPSCYQASDVYVFPTLFGAEGFGLSLLEAMACGLACAASDIEILRELYSAETVLLVPDPNLEDAFVKPILSLLSDSDLRARMGKAARSYASEHYHHEKILAQLKEFYRRQIAYLGEQH